MQSNVSARTAVVYCLAVLALLLTGVWILAGSGTASVAAAENGVGTTFPGTGVGAIPDRGVTGCGDPAGPPLDVTFNVTGLSGSPTVVDVDMNLTHSWVGDLNVSLIAPDATEHVIFASTGSTTATGCGDSSDLGGIYDFNDAASGDWWGEANTQGGTSILTPGSYRTTTAGDVAGGGVPTSINDAFAGVANPNGTWTLRIADGGGGDTGSISAANLTITTGAAPAAAVDNDYDGDGLTDFVITQEPPPPMALSDNSKTDRGKMKIVQPDANDPIGDSAVPEQAGTTLAWWILNSGSGTSTAVGFGQSRFADFVTPADFDGDGKADIAVWRRITTGEPSGNAFFYILNSSDSTVQEVDFGQFGDIPVVVGDYDGDGKADPAVFRQDGLNPGQSFFFYKGSAGGGEITFVPWGDNSGGNQKVYPGDFDGDGKYDFVVYRDVAGQGQFVLLRSSDLGVEYIDWGLSDDLLAPGDYDGDGKTDFMVVRLGDPSLNFEWYLLERDGGGTGASPIIWGTAAIVTANEYLTPGDYDGDGSTDIGVWRQDTSNSDNCFFYVRRSSDLTLQAVEWGASGLDTPVNGWTVQ
jgi:subtilisin-like proprotein convertase family protein